MLNYDEDDSKGSEWWNFFHKQCNVKDLQRIMAIDFETGYDDNDIFDKYNYFTHLPKVQQIQIIQDKVSKNNPEKYLDYLKSRAKLAFAARSISNDAKDLENTMPDVVA